MSENKLDADDLLCQFETNRTEKVLGNCLPLYVEIRNTKIRFLIKPYTDKKFKERRRSFCYFSRKNHSNACCEFFRDEVGVGDAWIG